MMHRVPLIVLATLVIFISCLHRETIEENDIERDITIVQSSDIFTTDPHTVAETVTHSVLYNVMEPLISLDGESKIDMEASLAEGWKNPDDLTWKFYIRSGVKFHNGKTLTAADVVASLLRAKDHPKSDVGGGLGKVASITTEGDHTVVIRMKEPSAILPYKLYNCMIMPKEMAQRFKDTQIDVNPIGTGPYRFVSWKKGVEVKLEAFDEYWGGRAAFDLVRFVPESDPETRVSMISNGEGDLVVDIPVDMVKIVKTWPQVKLISQESLRVIYLGFDMARDRSPYVEDVPSPLKNRKVREAIYQAIDEEEIIDEVLNGYGKPASQFCSPYVFGFNPKIERPGYDPERARQLLEEAGYPDGFSLTLHCPNNRYIKDKEIGERIVSQLREIGIDAKLQALPKETFIPALIDLDYSFFLMGWDCPDGDASSVFFDCLHSKDNKGYGSFNTGDYRNALLDSLINLLESTIDPVERTHLFEQAQEIGMNDLPWVPLHTQMNLYCVKNDISFNPRQDKHISLITIHPVRN